MSVPPDNQGGGSADDRRAGPRIDVTWAVDCSDGDTFLYSYIRNISTMGIFIATRTPPVMDTPLRLRFAPPGETGFELDGEVAWINPWREAGENLNPGFGVRFVNLTAEDRERLVSLVHAIAYLPDDEPRGD